MRWIALLLGLVFVVAACEDDPAPEPNLPTVEAAQAQCRKVEGVYKLNLVEVTVRDLDGADDLATPTVFVESEELTMQQAPKSDPVEGCEADACDVVYTWEHGRDSEQIYCGEDGKLLIVDFAVKDIEGFPAEASIKAIPL